MAYTPDGQATFDRLAALETDDCVEWPLGDNGKGYGQLSRGGKMLSTHRLALMERVGPPPEGKPHALHGPCHNTRCMNYRHLYWGSPSENQIDRHRDGVSWWGCLAGEDNPASKLTDDEVADLRHRYAAGGVTQRQLAAEFGISQGHVSDLVRRRRRSAAA